MRYPTLIALFVPVLIGLPAIASEWPTGGRDHFVQDCKTGAKSQIAPEKLARYCDCAAEEIGNDLSSAELKQLDTQKTPLPELTQKRMEQASASCLSQLND